MTVAAAQPRVASGDVATNAERHARLVERAAAEGARVVVFPELSLTGYHLDAAPVEPDGAPLTPLVEACRSTGALALVGAPTVTGKGRRHLSMLAIGDGDNQDDGGGPRVAHHRGPRVAHHRGPRVAYHRGPRVAYHKVNLGGGEATRFSPGSGPAVIEVDGWRLGLAICRDTGVPDHAGQTVAAGIDAYVAGVCEYASDREVMAERARRVVADHGVAVVVASFAGDTGEGYAPTAGCSGLWAADGRELARAGSEPDQLVTATLHR